VHPGEGGVPGGAESADYQERERAGTRGRSLNLARVRARGEKTSITRGFVNSRYIYLFFVITIQGSERERERERESLLFSL